MATKILALVFPGQGSQVVGMGKDFYSNFRESKLVFEEASDTIGVNLKKLCFDGPMDELTLTPNLQPALFTIEAAIFAAMRAHADFRPVVSAGHSLGEYSAHHAAGSLGLADGVRLTRRRGTAMQNAVPVGTGTMAAVLGLDAQGVDDLCAKALELAKNEIVQPANYNAPGQVVIAGTIDGIAAVSMVVKENPDFKRVKIIPLQVSAPFHCKMMEPAQKEMEPLLWQTSFKTPAFPVIANCTAHVVEAASEIPGLLIAQIVQPVRWEASMLELKTLGVEQVFEVGPGKVLSGLQKRIDKEMPMRNISSVEEMLEALK